jgi:hypothetical protein
MAVHFDAIANSFELMNFILGGDRPNTSLGIVKAPGAE